MKRNWKVSSYQRMLSFIIFSAALLVLVLTLYLFVGVGKDGGGVIFTFSNLSHVGIIYFLSLVSPVSEAPDKSHGGPPPAPRCGVVEVRTAWLYSGVCALVTRDNGRERNNVWLLI